MSIVHNEYTVPSATGVADVYVQSWVPDDKPLKGVFQMVHGMAEYSDRYDGFARVIADDGWAVFMHDHAGHGKSIKTKDDLGYFGDKDGYKALIEDVYTVTKLAKDKYPELPVFLYGHSMGSFVVRGYAAKYGGEIAGLIPCGTAGANPAAGIGAALAGCIAKVKGTHYRSEFINNLAFGSYNKRFTDGNTGFEWLSKNSDNVKAYCADELCGYKFTAVGYRDLFNLLASVNNSQWFASVPKDLPIRLIAGADDPVGAYGKGVTEVYDKLKETGHNVSIKIYTGLRHEIHNEKECGEVFSDIIAWLNENLTD